MSIIATAKLVCVMTKIFEIVLEKLVLFWYYFGIEVIAAF